MPESSYGTMPPPARRSQESNFLRSRKARAGVIASLASLCLVACLIVVALPERTLLETKSSRFALYMANGVNRDSRFLQLWNAPEKVADLKELQAFTNARDATLVIPPLDTPILLSADAERVVNRYLAGGNTIVLTGSPQAIQFLDQHLADANYKPQLSARAVQGPFFRQAGATRTPWERTAQQLPQSKVWGVPTSSLPKTATTLYAVADVSVVFSVPCETGRIVYVGYDYEQPSSAWDEIMSNAVHRAAENLPRHLPDSKQEVKPKPDPEPERPSPVRRPRNAVIIGVDGLKPACIQNATMHSAMDRLRAEGAWTLTNARTVLQAFSGPAWSTVMCAMPPEFTGVTTNTWVPPWMPKTALKERRKEAANDLQQAETDLQTVSGWNTVVGPNGKTEQQGEQWLSTTLLNSVDSMREILPVTGTATPFPCAWELIKQQRPELNTTFYYDWDWLSTLGNKCFNDGHGVGYIDNDWLCPDAKGEHVGYEVCDAKIAAKFAHDMKSRREEIRDGGDPADFFTFLYFGSADVAGHTHGWCTEEYEKAVGAIDTYIAEILNWVDDDTVVALVADHGGIPGTYYHAWGGEDSIVIPWMLKGPGVKQDYELQNIARNMDIIPTIFKLMEIEPSPWWSGKAIDEALENDGRW